MSDSYVPRHTFEVPNYVENPATVKISRITNPQKAGRCAQHNLSHNLLPEFLCIGASANNQAMKSMNVLKYLVESGSNGKLSVAFQPVRYKVALTDRETQVTQPYDCVVWHTVIIQK